MVKQGFICLLLAGAAWGQATNASPGSAAPGASNTPTQQPEAAQVASDAAVITIQGLCDNPPAGKTDSPDCKTVITRAQFEDILTTVAPRMPPAMKKQFATRYSSGLVMEHEAEKDGLDKGPKFDQMMRLSKIQVSQQMVNLDVQDKAGKIPEKDIADYYEKNKAGFEEADLLKIFIPRSKQLEPTKEPLSDDAEEKRQAEAETAMKKVAEEIQKKAAAGGDFTKLQKEAYDAAGLKNAPPEVAVGKLRRRQLAGNQETVMDLKAGSVSPLLEDANGYDVYKLISKDTVPLDKATDEIKGTMKSQRVQEMMQAIQKSATTTFNDAYFAPQGPPQGATPPMMMDMGKPGTSGPPSKNPPTPPPTTPK